jgi:hypothetical protein
MGLGGLAIQQTNERLTASLTRFQPKIADNIGKRKPLLDLLMKKKKIYSGGTEVGVRIRHKQAAKLGEDGGVGEYSYYDELNTTPTDTIKAMGESWSNFHVPIALSHEEMDENSGEHAFDRLKENTEFAMDDMSDNLNDVLWGISGGDGNKLPTPLTDIISGTDSLTLYGLAKGTGSANEFLNSQEVNAVGDLETELLDALREGDLLVQDNTSNKTDKVDAWITHRNVYLGIEKTLPQYVQVQSTSDADLGFDQIIFNKVPIRWDTDCPLDSDQKYQMFGMVLKYWQMGIRRQKNFTVTKFFDMLPKQAASVAQLFVSMAVVCNNPRTNVRVKGIEL